MYLLSLQHCIYILYGYPGTITGCCLDDNTAFGGFFIVRPDWRKRGVGKALRCAPTKARARAGARARARTRARARARENRANQVNQREQKREVLREA